MQPPLRVLNQRCTSAEISKVKIMHAETLYVHVFTVQAHFAFIFFFCSTISNPFTFTPFLPLLVFRIGLSVNFI